nr:leiomodin-3 [Hydra vulgaris]
MDEAFDLLDDLDEEELQKLNVELQNNDRLNAPNEKRREDDKERMFQKRDMVSKLDEMFIKKKAEATPISKPQSTGKVWKSPNADNKSINKVDTSTVKLKSTPANTLGNTNVKIENKNYIDKEDEDLLNDLTEEELIQLAAENDIHGLVSQDQYQSVLSGEKPVVGGFHANQPIKGTEKRILKSVSGEDLELDSVILMHCLRNDEDDLFSICINNIPLEINILKAIFDSLATSLKIKHLMLAAAGLTDDKVEPLLQALKTNTCLETLNLESNDLTSTFIEKLCRILENHPSIRELKCSHQKHGLGSKGEEALARLLNKNNKMLKVSYHFTVPSCRSAADRFQIKNQELQRQKRSQSEKFYNLSEEVKKRDEHPQRWMIPVQAENNSGIKAQLKEQMKNMKPVATNKLN